LASDWVCGLRRKRRPVAVAGVDSNSKARGIGEWPSEDERSLALLYPGTVAVLQCVSVHTQCTRTDITESTVLL
jgi:hypothetical protein